MNKLVGSHSPFNLSPLCNIGYLLLRKNMLYTSIDKMYRLHFNHIYKNTNNEPIMYIPNILSILRFHGLNIKKDVFTPFLIQVDEDSNKVNKIYSQTIHFKLIRRLPKFELENFDGLFTDDGDVLNFKKGVLHSTSAIPSVLMKNGVKLYHKEGILNNDKQPSIIYPDGRKHFYIDGKFSGSIQS